MPKKQTKATKPNNTTKQTKVNKLTVAPHTAQEVLVGYDDFLRDVKMRICSAQSQAMRAVKNEITANAARPLASIRDEEVFNFLSLGDEYKERELERGLVHKIRDFLLELGNGFAFLGAQYHLEVGGQDFYLDLLFYHIYLRRLITFDLKLRDFTPEDAGQMNFYLAVLDDLVKAPEDQPSIGIILCKGKNNVVVEYALRDVKTPIGVASYRLQRELPAELRKALPAPEEFETLLRDEQTTTKKG
ncbi:MAG: DUF1016 domain-containing protein [Acidobacteria bacterium]|nr:DUF1016 domain-containing protein [Acidobacteriota bacterium]